MRREQQQEKSSPGNEKMKRKAVFIDRDGTINKEVNYLHRIEDLEILPGVAEAIKLLNDAGFLVVVPTNQSGIARGYYAVEDMQKINDEISRQLAEKGAHIDAFYFCPHHPGGKVEEFALSCDCRKPKPGMFLKAAEDYNIDFAESFSIGDKIRDLEPAVNLGCRGVLVKTGYGEEELKERENWQFSPDYIADDLLDGAGRIVKKTL